MSAKPWGFDASFIDELASSPRLVESGKRIDQPFSATGSGTLRGTGGTLYGEGSRKFWGSRAICHSMWVDLSSAAGRFRTWYPWKMPACLTARLSSGIRKTSRRLGLLKVDILALGMLSAIRKSLDMISRDHPDIRRIQDIPREDAATYRMLQKADSLGVFQIESRAQMSMLPRLKPACLLRPGDRDRHRSTRPDSGRYGASLPTSQGRAGGDQLSQ